MSERLTTSRLDAPGLLVSPSGTYQVESTLGQGGFGVTYLARRADLPAPVVVKLLRPERLESWKAVELFEREAQVLQRLEHPNIPRYIDHFELSDDAGVLTGLALVQSFVRGATLQATLGQPGAASPGRLVGWMLDVLRVCEHLHGLLPPVIHRDLNPNNIIIREEDGQAVVIDFGTVQAAFRAAQELSSTSAGTFGYAPMEQLVGRASAQSDLYSLGVTVVVALTGRQPQQLPFEGARLDVGRALEGMALDPRLLRALTQMTEPDPKRRPASASALLAALGPLGGPSAARPLTSSVAPASTSPASTAPALPTPALPAPGAGSAGATGDIHGDAKGGESALDAQAPSLQAIFSAQALARAPQADRDAAQALLAHDQSLVQARREQLGQRWAWLRELERALPAQERVQPAPPRPAKNIQRFALSEDGRVALVVGYDAYWIVDMTSLSALRVVDEPRQERVGALSADGRWAAILDPHQRRLHLHDLALPQDQPGARQDVTLRSWPKDLELSELRVALDPQGELLVVLCQDVAPLVYEARSGAVAQRLTLRRGATAHRVTLSPGGDQIIVEHDEGVSVFSDQGQSRHEPWVCAALSLDGQSGAVVLKRDPCRVYLTGPSLQIDGARAVVIASHEDRGDLAGLRLIRYSPDGRHLVLVNRYDQIALLDVVSRSLVLGAPDEDGDREPWFAQSYQGGDAYYSDLMEVGVTSDGLRLLAHVEDLPGPLFADGPDEERFVVVHDLASRQLLGALRLYVKEPSCIGLRLFAHGLAVPRGQEREVIAREGGLSGLFGGVEPPPAPSPDDPRWRTAQALKAAALDAAALGQPRAEGAETILVFEAALGIFGRALEEAPLGFEAPVDLERPALARQALREGTQALDALSQEGPMRLWRQTLAFLMDLRSCDVVPEDAELTPLAHALDGVVHLSPLFLLRALRQAQGLAPHGSRDARPDGVLGASRRFGALAHSDPDEEHEEHEEDDLDEGDLDEYARVRIQNGRMMLRHEHELSYPDGEAFLSVSSLIDVIERAKARGPQALEEAWDELMLELELALLSQLRAWHDEGQQQGEREDQDPRAAAQEDALDASSRRFGAQGWRPSSSALTLTLYAPEDGAWAIPMVSWDVSEGGAVRAGQVLGSVAHVDVVAPCAGVVRWLCGEQLGQGVAPGARLVTLELDPKDAAKRGLHRPESLRLAPRPIMAPKGQGRMIIWEAAVADVVRQGQVLARDALSGAAITSPCDGLLLQIFVEHMRMGGQEDGPLGLIQPSDDPLTSDAGGAGGRPAGALERAASAPMQASEQAPARKAPPVLQIVLASLALIAALAILSALLRS